MKNLLLTGVLSVLIFQLSAQQAYTYRFNNNFQEANGNGPALQQICTGNFSFENLPDYNISQQVYNFDNNCGFSFDDAAGFIASGNYTIELYFKMTALTSWKRVIDFKNRTTDKGCYVLNGQMNFYNIATSSGTPFQQDEYSHYVITRDAVTKNVIMYGDGNHYIAFNDGNDDAVYDAGKKLSFFQDDLIVANESSAGSIALLRIHNYAMDSATVKASFNTLSGTLTSLHSIKAGTIAVSMFPNPANSKVDISLPDNASYSYQLTDAIGKLISKGSMTSGKNSLSLETLAPGMYNLTIRDNKGNMANKRLIKQ